MPGVSVVDGQCVMTCKMHIFECARMRCKCMHFWLKEHFIQAALPGWVQFSRSSSLLFRLRSLGFGVHIHAIAMSRQSAWASALHQRFVCFSGDEQRSLDRHALYILFLEPESSGGDIQQSHIRPSSGFGLTTYIVWISQEISLLSCVSYVAL